MEGVALLLAAAAAGFVLARAFHMPPIPFLLVAGTVLSLLHPPDREVLEDALVLGVALLLFIAGLELEPKRVRAQRRAALRVGFVQFWILALVGFGASLLLGFGTVESGYLALALAASSTLVCVRLLQRRRQMFEPFGRLVIGVLLLQDVLVLLSIPFVTQLTRSWEEALPGLGGLALLAVASLAVRRWLAPLLLRVQDEEELLLLGALTVLFLFAGGAWVLRLPLVVGAFLAGVSLSRFPVREIVRVELAPIGVFFTAIFFVALGAIVRLPTPGQVLAAAVLGLIVLVLTPPLVTVVAERSGFTATSAIEAGLLLAQTSEISLVIGLAGMTQGLIGDAAFTVIALFTGGTMVLTPFISTDSMSWKLVHLHPSRWSRGPDDAAPRDHLVLVGCGSTGARLVDLFLMQDVEVVVVDEDPAVLRQFEDTPILAIRGDATSPEVLRRAGVHRARAVVSTVHRARDNAGLLDETRGETPVLVRVFEETDARWIRERGGIPVLYAEATADAFMDWYDTVEEELDERQRAREELGGERRRPGG